MLGEEIKNIGKAATGLANSSVSWRLSQIYKRFYYGRC